MKKLLLLLGVLHVMILPTTVQGANDKIDPATFICAELVATGMSSEAPIFEALQIDGYVSASKGWTVADSNIMLPLMTQIYAACEAKPAEKIASLWEKLRPNFPVSEESKWRADSSTCKQYAENEDDGSGFIIWLDGYNRKKNNTGKSVLESDAKVNAYIESCKKKPDALMIDVLNESLQ